MSRLYVTYGGLPQVNDTLFILKPAVLGIIRAGVIKPGRMAIKSTLLAALPVGVIFAVALGLSAEALVNFVGVSIALASFVLIILLKRDAALAAVGAMAGGLVQATVRAVFRGAASGEES